MSDTFILIYIFLQKYLVPVLFTIGLVYFIYGCINYFIIGHHSGDEGRSQLGRELLLKSCTWFAAALLAYSVIAAIGWLSSQAREVGTPASDAGTDAGAGGQIQRDDAYLIVPNVPKREEE